MIRSFFVALVLASLAVVSHAGSFMITSADGREQSIFYTKKTLKKKGVIQNSGQMLEYSEVVVIRTDNFDAYEKAVNRTSNERGSHIKLEFTGDQSVHVQRLEKLEKKRKGAGIARGAGGVMMLLGVLSGDRAVTAVGLATYGGGTVARNINTDKTIQAQNDAIRELSAQQKQLSEADNLEEQFRIEWGNENVDGVIALIDNSPERALALANVGETSKDANHRLSAAWLKALIYADTDDTDALAAEYERLLVLDPETESVADAEEYMAELLQELGELRNTP